MTPRDDRSRPDLRLPSQGRPKRGGFLFRGRIRRHPSSGAPWWRCPVAEPTGRSSPLPPRWRTGGQAELVGIHVVEIDWTLPLDADVAGRSEDAQRVLDIAEATAEAGHYKLETVLLQARDVGAAIVDEATERAADLVIAGPSVPPPVRRRLRHRANDPVHPEERPVRRVGDPRGHARGASMKAVIVGCGRVGAALADELDRAGWQVLIIDLRRRPSTGCRPPSRGPRSAATAPTRTRCASTARATPTCSWPSRRATTGTSWRPSSRSRRSAPAAASPRSTTRSAPRPMRTWASRPCAGRT